MNYENCIIKSINIVNNPHHLLYSHIIYYFGLRELIKNIEAVFICECGFLIPLFYGRRIDPISLHLNSRKHDTEVLFKNQNCCKIRRILNILKENK